MEEYMDESRRIRMSKRMMKDALLELMEEKPLSRISVTAICETADVNRSTFYAYYNETSDLLHDLENDIFEQMKVQASSTSIAKLLTCLQKFGEAEQILKMSSNQRTAFETISLEAMLTEKDIDMLSVNSRLDKLEQKLEELLKNE